ncbi:unnamed protein product [Lactuca virosa]|uniref:Replication factor A C-terminal domain-containing protein n=1 Tax=Lactuca virosa TaxID=75947 RepID=A0AAU9P4S7_9ASTR|nr:unnamed protein product [Lactuca virosa]
MRKGQKRSIIESGECSVSATPVMRTSKRSRLISYGGLPTYYDCGDCVCVCEFCGALFCIMTNISDLKYACEGGPLQVRILRKWKSDYRRFHWCAKKIRNCTKADREEFILVILADESGDETAISLWKECINVPEKLKREQLAPPPATTIVAITNIKSSIIAGTLRFGSSPATHVYVNPPIQETTLLIDRFTGPTPPTPTLSGPLITVHELINKNHNDLLDKTFCVKGVLSKITVKDYWFQVLCPTCKDPIFRKGNYWFCSAHGKTELPTFLYKIVIDLTDPTGSIYALMTDASARKLIGSPPKKIITDDHRIYHQKHPFIIVDVHEITAPNKTLTPVTPTQILAPTNIATPLSPIQLPQSSNVQINPNLETTSTTSETPHAARKLSYDTTAESAPKKQQKRGRRVQ